MRGRLAYEQAVSARNDFATRERRDHRRRSWPRFLDRPRAVAAPGDTAAHCLPHLPPPHPASYTYERTYPNLLGPIGGQPSVAAECVFVDPIADVAVLDVPDGQVLYDESEAYESFVEARPALHIGAIRRRCQAWLFTLDGRWEEC
jgi:hypothetical protein